jgi:hypothetical protein
MYSTNYIIDCVLENDALTEQWLEFALILEQAGEFNGAALALEEAIEYESWKLLWRERLFKQETEAYLDAEMLRFLWLDLPDTADDELIEPTFDGHASVLLGLDKKLSPCYNGLVHKT